MRWGGTYLIRWLHICSSGCGDGRGVEVSQWAVAEFLAFSYTRHAPTPHARRHSPQPPHNPESSHSANCHRRPALRRAVTKARQFVNLTTPGGFWACSLHCMQRLACAAPRRHSQHPSTHQRKHGDDGAEEADDADRQAVAAGPAVGWVNGNGGWMGAADPPPCCPGGTPGCTGACTRRQERTSRSPTRLTGTH